MLKRVVVTGMGTVNPLGLNVNDSWQAAKKGVNGIGPITKFDASKIANNRCLIAGEVKNLNVAEFVDVKDVKRMSDFIMFGYVAATQAIKDSKIEVTDELADDIGVLIGTGVGGFETLQAQAEEVTMNPSKKTSPFTLLKMIPSMVAANVSIKYNLRGPSFAISSACTTSNHSIGEAMLMIRSGRVKAMLAGGSEATVCWSGLLNFDRMNALSRRNDSPEIACRPYDSDRDGFVMAEGSAVLFLEEYEHAIKRGAKIYCEISGYGASSDAFHITAPNVEGPAMAMKKALIDANIAPKEVDYINSHATSTLAGDVNELEAIAKVFGEDLAHKVSISSTKSMTGHLLGGAGAVEAVFSIMAMIDGFVPPTTNIFNLDEKCAKFDITPNVGKVRNVNTALSNGFGFGGTNGCLIFKKL